MNALKVKVSYFGPMYPGDTYVYGMQIDGKDATRHKACGRDIQIYLNGLSAAQFALTGRFDLDVEYDHSAAFLMSAHNAQFN